MPTLVSQQNDIWRMSTHKYSILMTCHYPDLRGASDGWKQIVLIVWTIRSTVPYPDLVMTHHQYGISALVPQQGSTQDSSLEWVHHLGMRDKEYEYEEEGFCLGNIILWTSDNTYQYSRLQCQTDIFTAFNSSTSSHVLLQHQYPTNFFLFVEYWLYCWWGYPPPAPSP